MKNRKVYRNIGLLALLTLILTACPKKEEQMWKDTYWVLTELPGHKLQVAPEGREISLHLPEGPNGPVEGFAGCNRFFGTCSLEDQKLAFSRMASTKMMCPRIDTERAFLSALEAADGYLMEKEQLQLLAGEKVLAVLSAYKEQP